MHICEMGPVMATRSMLAGTSTVRPAESVKETVPLAAALDDDEALEALPDALAALELDEPPHPASPKTIAQHTAMQHATIAFLDPDNTFPWSMVASLSTLGYF